MEAAIETMASDGIMTRSLVGEGGIQSQQMTRGIPSSAIPSLDGVEWPETLPIFKADAIRISPEGEVWVERMMPVGAPARVDMFDREGIRRGYIELPPNSKVIGFGDGTDDIVYLARTDDVGLIWLERYRITRAGE